MDGTQRFLSQLFDTNPGDVADLTPTELDDMARLLSRFTISEQLPVMADSMRDRLYGKRTLPLPLFLRWCADGLRKVPALAKALEQEPDALDELANRDLTLGGLIKSIELLQQGGQDRALYTGHTARALQDQARQALARYLSEAPSDAGLVGAVFEMPHQIEAQMEAARAAAGDPGDQPQREEIAAVNNRSEQLRLVAEMAAAADAANVGRGSSGTTRSKK